MVGPLGEDAGGGGGGARGTDSWGVGGLEGVGEGEIVEGWVG